MPILRCFSVSFLYLLFNIIHGPWFIPKHLSYDWSNYNCRSSICFIKLFIAYSIQYCSSITGPVKEHGWRNLFSEKRSSQENSHRGIQSHNISKGDSSNIQEGTSLVCFCFLWSKLCLNYMFAVYNFSPNFVIKRHQSKIMQPVDWGAWGWKMSKMFLYWRSCFCDQHILDCFVCLILLPLGIVHFSSFINIIFCINFYAHV